MWSVALESIIHSLLFLENEVWRTLPDVVINVESSLDAMVEVSSVTVPDVMTKAELSLGVHAVVCSAIVAKAWVFDL